MALAVCLLCLVGIFILGGLAARRRWNLVAPSTLGLWIVAVMLILFMSLGGLA